MDRHLDWDGCFNVRDLGGLPTTDGGSTRTRALVRSDAVDKLTAQGWKRLEDHGVRTVIDLRNEDELRPDTAPRPKTLTTVHLPLDGVEDREFWDEWGDGRHGTPLYYRPFLERFPQRAARTVEAVAAARPGGVLFHCMVGRDRTGLVTLLLLALAGVTHEGAVGDFELSAARLVPLFDLRGEPDAAQAIRDVLRRADTTARDLIVSLLGSLDVNAYLRDAGLSEETIGAARARLR